ncbi:MAG: universal stress protein [Anaerolineales bacterium]|nr:universal stress protein [Anaerolineales bacterium]
MSQESPQFAAALRDFRRARQRATLERILARLTQQPAELLDYDEVRQKLHAGKSTPRGLRQIPLDAIVGSVGRYADFTRSFLPRRESSARRWAAVRTALPDVAAFPPITVYQVGEAYFVLDGNHRVSVARQAGATHIPAYVTEIETPVPLTPDARPDELICQAKQADFLVETGLGETRPSTDFGVTAPGQYRVLLEQIAAHRQRLARDAGQPPALADAAVSWHDAVYLPVVRLIRQRGILRHFPGRTETDLYAWIARHRAELHATLGWNAPPESVASDLVTRFSPAPRQVLRRVRARLAEALTPEPLEPGPPPGRWRAAHAATDHLFRDVLVPLRAGEMGRCTLAQGLVVAQREGSRLHGLHVQPPGTEPADEPAAQFRAQCAAAGVAGDFAVLHGDVAAQLAAQTRWADLLVYAIAHPPHERPLARLSANLHTLLRQAACPVLVVPGQPAPLARALLAYDGSAKAKEALFVSAYLAAKWDIPLVVVTVAEAVHAGAAVLDDVRAYLAARGVAATFVAGQGDAAEVIAETAVAHACDFVVMGGYGFRPLLEVLLGSTVDRILRLRQWPVLVCR